MTPLQHPRLRDIGGYLNGIREQVASLVTSTPREAMDRSRGDQRWSGTQIVQHLGKVEGSTAKLLEGVFTRALADGLPEESSTTSLLGAIDRFTTDGRTLRPLVAPERLRPEPTPDLDASWASLQAVRERTWRAYQTVDGRDLTKISAPHPFFGPLNGYEWLEFVGRHEERHLGQLRRELNGG